MGESLGEGDKGIKNFCNYLSARIKDKCYLPHILSHNKDWALINVFFF